MTCLKLGFVGRPKLQTPLLDSTYVAFASGETFSVSGIADGLDATGYGQFIVVASGTETLTGLGPVDVGGNLTSGMMLNPTVEAGTQAFDARISGSYSAAQAQTATIDVGAGDIVLKARSFATPIVVGEHNDGYLEAVRPLWVVDAPLGVNDVLLSAVGWSSRPATRVINLDLPAHYGALSVRDMSVQPGLPDYAAVKAQLIKYPAAYAVVRSTNSGFGYENLVPEGFNAEAGSGYDSENADTIHAAALIVLDDGSQYTYAERFDMYCLLVRIGLDCALPIIDGGVPMGPDGGHRQSMIVPAALALHALGRGAEIANLETVFGGSMLQWFEMTQAFADANMVPHDDLGLSATYRRRTLADQSGAGANQIIIPTQYGGAGGEQGDWYQTYIAAGSKVVRESDGAEATVTTAAKFPQVSTGTLTLDLDANVTPAFSASDVIHFTFPPEFAVGDTGWALRGLSRPQNVTLSAENAYTEFLRREGDATQILNLLGLLPTAGLLPRIHDFTQAVEGGNWPATDNVWPAQGAFLNTLDFGPVAATTTAAITSIDSYGWEGTTAAPVGDVGEALAVTRAGYDVTGAATSFVEAIDVTSRVRLPGSSSDTADPVALADYIYTGEAIDGGVANASTRAYPKAQFTWLMRDRQVIDGDSVTLRIAVAHRYARNGRPVAGVRFIVRDHLGAEAAQLVTACVPMTYSASGLTASAYEGTVDITALSSAGARDQTFTIDAEFLPWVGEAHRISTMTAGFSNSRNTTLTFGNNRNDWRPRVYVYVSPTGNNGTGVASTTAATAQASPFATTSAANGAMRNWYATNVGRGTIDGGVMRLEAGTHTHASWTRRTCDNYATTVEGAPGTTPSQVIYQDAGTTTGDGFPDLVHVEGLTLRKTSAAAVVFLDSDNSGDGVNYISMLNVTLDDSGNGTAGSMVRDYGSSYYENCTQTDRLSSCNKAVGCNGPFLAQSTTSYVATRDPNGQIAPNVATRAEGLFIGWNFLSTDRADHVEAVLINHTTGEIGMGIVGNVIEHFATTGGASFLINSDGTTNESENINLIGNTFLGGRTNISYTDAGGSTRYDHTAVMRFNIFYQRNTKSGDFFGYGGEGTAPSRVGNWGVRYGVGAASNTILQGQSQNTAPNGFYPRSWMGDAAPAGSITGSIPQPLSVSFTNNQAGNGGTGGGDYTPTALTDLATFTAAQAFYPSDLLGRSLLSGGVSGAAQLIA